MIKDILIIKDGVPLYSNSSDFSSNPLFSNQNNLLMISGFFSALNSFSDHFDNLGTIKELKLSKMDLRLSLFRDNNNPNLLFLATHDLESNAIDVQRTLKGLSNTFMQKYNADQIIKWSGRVEAFKSFDKIVNKHIEEEQTKKQAPFIEDIDGMSEVIQGKWEQKVEQKVELNRSLENIPSFKFGDFIPTINASTKINTNYYLSDPIASKIYNHIDGMRSINKISADLSIEAQKVFNCCKTLMKFNFIKLQNRT